MRSSQEGSLAREESVFFWDDAYEIARDAQVNSVFGAKHD